MFRQPSVRQPIKRDSGLSTNLALSRRSGNGRKRPLLQLLPLGHGQRRIPPVGVVDHINHLLLKDVKRFWVRLRRVRGNVHRFLMLDDDLLPHEVALNLRGMRQEMRGQLRGFTLEMPPSFRRFVNRRPVCRKGNPLHPLPNFLLHRRNQFTIFRPPVRGHRLKFIREFRMRLKHPNVCLCDFIRGLTRIDKPLRFCEPRPALLNPLTQFRQPGPAEI